MTVVNRYRKAEGLNELQWASYDYYYNRTLRSIQSRVDTFGEEEYKEMVRSGIDSDLCTPDLKPILSKYETDVLLGVAESADWCAEHDTISHDAGTANVINTVTYNADYDISVVERIVQDIKNNSSNHWDILMNPSAKVITSVMHPTDGGYFFYTSVRD